jgi:hypothetical protein
MNLLQVRTELEDERTWRRDEIRFLLNRLADLDTDDDKDRYRRAVLLLLYAHFEGFCKTALLIYVHAINGEGLSCQAVQPALTAATCRPILRALADQNSKSDFFRGKAPEDEKLHFAWRCQEFLSRLSDVLGMKVSIPDDVVDTESNLWPIVLKKNLFRLGFEQDRLKQHDGTISNLVNRRNNIAHGMQREGISKQLFAELQKSVYEVMDEVMAMVMEALKTESYLSSSLASTAGPEALQDIL